MQPENTAQFNPLDFSKLTLQQQFEAARTMNQKELMAVAGAGIPLETLLKYQGLSDAQIKQRLAELNPYLASFSAMHEKEAGRHQSAPKHSLAELYALLEEQGHSNTNSPQATGHKLGDITHLSHEQQVHVLAEHFAHGGSTSEALAARGESTEAQREQERLEAEYKQQNKAKLAEIEQIEDPAEKAKKLLEFNRGMRESCVKRNVYVTEESRHMLYQADARVSSKNSEVAQDSAKIICNKNLQQQANNKINERIAAKENGTANDEDIASLE